MKSRGGILKAFAMIKNRIPALVLMTVANSAVAVLSVFFALGSRNIIDVAVSGQWDGFKKACAMQFALIVSILFSLFLFRYLRERLSSEIDRDLKKIFLNSAINSEYNKTSEYHSGELINRVSNDIRILIEGFFATIPGLFSMVIKIVFAFFALWKIQRQFAYFVLVSGVFVVILTAAMRYSLKTLHKKVSKADGAVTSFLQEIFEKLLIVQAMGAEDEIEKRADGLLKDRFDLQMKRKNFSLVANISINSLSYIGSFAALVWCAAGILNGMTTFGELTAVIQLMAQIQNPVANITGVIPQYVAMVAAWERLDEIFTLDRKKETGDVDALIAYDEMQSICCRDLTFTYDRDVVFDKAAFEVKKGSFVTIKGSSGIGKSTLLKLMLGIYKPEDGKFFLKKQDGEIAVDNLQKGIFCYVPQGNLLLSGTIKDNLLLSHPQADEQMLKKAIYVSCMDEYLPGLPDGLDTVLTENSGGLSEGQAQRIAIARAVLSGAPILLMDEITSALDVETERKVLQRIKSLDNVTCFIVTHRPVPEEYCDVTLEIENGKIIMK